MNKNIKDKLREIIKAPLYVQCGGKCPFCDRPRSKFNGNMGLSNHIRKAHPDKFRDKTDRVADFIDENFKTEVDDWCHKFTNGGIVVRTHCNHNLNQRLEVPTKA